MVLSVSLSRLTLAPRSFHWLLSDSSTSMSAGSLGINTVGVPEVLMKDDAE